MRHIAKPTEQPPSIREYLTSQTPVGHGLDYKTFASTASPQGGSRGGQLCGELTHQQFGLCAYTGAGIDERLGKLENPNAQLKFARHNEHLKPQSDCREQLIAAGKQPGVDLSEDMDHQNIVAALLVSGGGGRVAKDQLFGAAHRENDPVPLLPTDPSCEQRFSFDQQGFVSATNIDDSSAAATIEVLNLKCPVLRGWREQAIRVWLDAIETTDDVRLILERMANPTAGQLPEYCFAISRVVRAVLPSTP